MSTSTGYQLEEPGISITELILEDVTFCDPNGAAEIREITRDGVVEDISNFEITWYYYENYEISTGPRVEFLNPGQYFVSARHIETGTESERKTFLLNDNTIRPVVDIIILNPNTSCDPLNPTGSIRAFVRGAYDEYNFDFIWFEGPSHDLKNIISFHTSSVSQLSAGIYTVEVRDFITGCHSLMSVYLPEEITQPQLNVEVQNSTDCQDNGEVQVVEILESGSIQDLNEYNFDFYNSENVLLAEGSTLFTQLSAGTYYVSATNIFTQCKSDLVKIDIINDYDTSGPSTNFTVIGPNPDFSRCENGPMTLEAQGGEYFRWYDARHEGELLHEGKAYTIENLQKSTSIWVSGYDPVCDLESDRKELSLKVISLPLITSVKADLEQAKITAEASGLIKWFLDDAELVGQNEQTIVAHTDGIYTVEVINGDCNESKSISFKGLSFSKPENIVKAPLIPNSTYQWSLNNQLIAHETFSTLNVSENGVYSVKIVFLEESEEVTKTHTLNYSIEVNDIETITGLPNSYEDPTIEIYPVPFDRFITINLDRTVQESVAVRMWDIRGHVKIDNKVMIKGDKVSLDIPELEKGIYFLEVIYSQGSFMSKIIK